MKRKKMTADELDKLSTPTLEDILAFINNGKYDKFFLKNPKVYDNGESKEYLTKKGSILYGKLVTLLYACHRLADIDDAIPSVVDELDFITTIEC